MITEKLCPLCGTILDKEVGDTVTYYMCSTCPYSKVFKTASLDEKTFLKSLEVPIDMTPVTKKCIKCHEIELHSPSFTKCHCGGELQTYEEQEVVNSPLHYTQGGIECIDALKAALTLEEFRGFLKGNAIKYLWRINYKTDPAIDAKKAQWYINRLVEELDNGN